MTIQYCIITANGERQMLDAINEHYSPDSLRRLDRAQRLDDVVDAYSLDAETSADNGNGCEFEIEARVTRTGAPIIVRITDDGYEMRDVDVDE